MARTFPLLALSIACGPKPDLDSDPAWALNWAEVVPAESGLEGYQVWQLFVEGWDDNHADEFFKCSVIQDLGGSVSSCPQTGVPTCYATYEITLDLSADQGVEACSDGVNNDGGWDGPPWMALGALPTDLEADAPYDEYVLGWYIGYDENTWLAHGYAYPKILEEGGAPAGLGWLNDETYILWPAYVWEL